MRGRISLVVVSRYADATGMSSTHGRVKSVGKE